MRKCSAEYEAEAHMRCAGCRELLCTAEGEHKGCPGCHRYPCRPGDQYDEYLHWLNAYGRYTCLDYPEEPEPEPEPEEKPQPKPEPKPEPKTCTAPDCPNPSADHDFCAKCGTCSVVSPDDYYNCPIEWADCEKHACDHESMICEEGCGLCMLSNFHEVCPYCDTCLISDPDHHICPGEGPEHYACHSDYDESEHQEAPCGHYPCTDDLTDAIHTTKYPCAAKRDDHNNPNDTRGDGKICWNKQNLTGEARNQPWAAGICQGYTTILPCENTSCDKYVCLCAVSGYCADCYEIYVTP